MTSIDQWECLRKSAIREARQARFQQRQHYEHLETLEFPELPAETWRDRIAGLGLLAQMLWWLITGKVFGPV